MESSMPSGSLWNRVSGTASCGVDRGGGLDGGRAADGGWPGDPGGNVGPGAGADRHGEPGEGRPDIGTDDEPPECPHPGTDKAPRTLSATAHQTAAGPRRGEPRSPPVIPLGRLRGRTGDRAGADLRRAGHSPKGTGRGTGPGDRRQLGGQGRELAPGS